VRLLRSHGEGPRHRHRIVGTTARLDGIQAAVLRVKLRRLDHWNAARRRIGAELTRALRVAPVQPPAAPGPGQDHVFHQYVIESAHRDSLRDHLYRHGVATAIHYPIPIHRSEAYASLALDAGSFPVAERLAERICSLPMFPGMSSDDTDRVARAVMGFGPSTARRVAA
jgi:dTDP-3-amino-3,4,6-trideoxy-alpha-D-glucose transaminase